uniref:PIN domain-containing protein n=1 Tax=Strigamia maritima TaxID=126957 RepID=T1JAG5_STRMM
MVIKSNRNVYNALLLRIYILLYIIIIIHNIHLYIYYIIYYLVLNFIIYMYLCSIAGSDNRNILLPCGWTAHTATKINPGQIYFHRRETQETFWNLKDVFESEAKAKQSATAAPVSVPTSIPESVPESVPEPVPASVPVSRKRKNVYNTDSTGKFIKIDEVLPECGRITSTSKEMTNEMESILNEMTLNVGEMKQKLQQTSVDSSTSNSSDLETIPSTEDAETKQLAKVQKTMYVITDTNILIHNLDLFKKLLPLTEHKIVFIIPWIVLQELDKLKRSTKDVNLQAREAVRFIDVSLADPTSGVKGQTLKAATQLKNELATTNDDQILLCCIDFNEILDSSTVLLTNDRNLRSKTHANNCIALSSDNIRDRLTKHVRDNTDIVQIYESFKSIVFDILSFVLNRENERKKFIAIKKALTLADVFDCILEYWETKFRFIFRNDHDVIFESLAEFFMNDGGLDEPLSGVSFAIQQSLLLFRKQGTEMEISSQMEKLSSLSLECQSGVTKSSSLGIVAIILCDVVNKVGAFCASVSSKYSSCGHKVSEKEVHNEVTKLNKLVINACRELSLVVGNSNLNENGVRGLFEALQALHPGVKYDLNIEILYRFCILEERKDFLKRCLTEMQKLRNFLRKCDFVFQVI